VTDDRLARIALAMILVFVVCAVFAPLIAPYDPTEADPALRLRPPGTEGHLLGLDNQGRDILSRLIYGARITLLAGVIPVVFGALISIPLGMIGAWYRRFGEIVMRFMDVLFAFPMVLLAVMLAALMGPGLGNMLIALVIVLVPYNTRVVYAEACQQRGQAYVEAARATATPDIKILFVEMLPNVVAASVVYSCTIVGSIVITAAGLSFLGLGIQPPAAEWGIMTSEGRTYLFVAPHISTIPGIAITLLVIAFNLLGDSLRDALDPRTRLQLIRRKEPSKSTP
jgi:peptide/nickel transport system permease protein